MRVIGTLLNDPQSMTDYEDGPYEVMFVSDTDQHISLILPKPANDILKKYPHLYKQGARLLVEGRSLHQTVLVDQWVPLAIAQPSGLWNRLAGKNSK